MKTLLVSGFLALSLFAHYSQAAQIKHCIATSASEPNYTMAVDITISWEADTTTVNLEKPWHRATEFDVVYSGYQESGNQTYVGVSNNKREMVIIDWQNQDETRGELRVGDRMSPVPLMGKYASYTLQCN